MAAFSVYKGARLRRLVSKRGVPTRIGSHAGLNELRSRARRKHATPLLRASSGSGKQAALLKREANEPSASLSQSNNNTMLYSAGHLERHTGNPQRGGQALGPLRSPSRGRLRILGVPSQREGGITLAGWASGAAWATCAARERWDPPRFPPSSALRRKCSSRDP